MNFNAPLVQQAYFAIDDLKQENQFFSKEIYRLTSHQTTVLAWAAMERKYNQRDIDTVDEYKEVIAEMASALISAREQLFEMKLDELWNFSICLYDKERDLLVPIWREKHENHPAEGLGRCWPQGVGHIGKAFADRRPLITDDATDPKIAALVAPREAQRRDYDAEVYRSFAAIPIGTTKGDEEDAFGVLAATSDQVSRFDRANSFILRHFAVVLANIIERHHIDVSSIPVESTCAMDGSELQR